MPFSVAKVFKWRGSEALFVVDAAHHIADGHHGCATLVHGAGCPTAHIAKALHRHRYIFNVLAQFAFEQGVGGVGDTQARGIFPSHCAAHGNGFARCHRGTE